jgi:hypothetical protein
VKVQRLVVAQLSLFSQDAAQPIGEKLTKPLVVVCGCVRAAFQPVPAIGVATCHRAQLDTSFLKIRAICQKVKMIFVPT